MKRKPTKRTIKRPTRRKPVQNRSVTTALKPRSKAHVIEVSGGGGAEVLEVAVHHTMGRDFPQARQLADYIAAMLNAVPGRFGVESFHAYDSHVEEGEEEPVSHIYVSRKPRTNEAGKKVFDIVVVSPADDGGTFPYVLMPNDRVRRISQSVIDILFEPWLDRAGSLGADDTVTIPTAIAQRL
jgi:hypothetical protein